MRALGYFFSEASASLWRRPGAALVSILTIAAGLFVLGLFLVLNVNLEQVIGRWGESAELSVYLEDTAELEDIVEIERHLDASGLVASRERLSKADAAARFREDFPDLAGPVGEMEGNPFPASVEVRIRPDMRDAGSALDALARNLAALPGVGDVRYDRRWLTRLHALTRLARGVALLIVAILAVAAALTVANVVRLAAAARRDEIHIMQLVGAPMAYVRGPFVVEGLLQGGLGALLALLALWGALLALQARFGASVAEALGAAAVLTPPLGVWLGLLGGGMLLGGLGGWIVARGVR